MSHRSFEAPRHGNLGFLPRKRCRRGRGRVKAFPKDDATKAPHLTAFIGFKAGLTHVVRELHRPASRLHQKEVLEAVTLLDCPPLVVVGMVGYVKTPRGLRTLTTAWTNHLSEEFLRRFYKNWYRSAHTAFAQYRENAEKKVADLEKKLAMMKKHCCVIRLLAHTQHHLLPLVQKKAHIIEIQINGGDVNAKVEFGKALFEKEIHVGEIFAEGENIDTIGITTGKGFVGTHTRLGTRLLPRKTNKGYRKVACIGPWHPSRISWTTPRAGQGGFHHRVELNKRIYRVGTTETLSKSASTEFDITEKSINPMGGFPHYGVIKNDFIMIKGSVPGPKKRAITLRKSILPFSGRRYTEALNIRWISTASKMGHGRFQTSEEKAAFYGH